MIKQRDRFHVKILKLEDGSHSWNHGRSMADSGLRTEVNIAGRYYVDSSCVHCELCQTLAEDHFATTAVGEGYVYNQPRNTAEMERCNHAKENCPVGAIGDDGTDHPL